MVPEIFVDSSENLGDLLAARVEAEARRSFAARSRFALALSGGSVGEAFFARLSRAGVDWAAAEFFWTDERAVAHSDPESNYRLARSLWLDPSNVPQERRHPMEADSPDLHKAATAYASVLTNVLGRPPRLDLVLMGVGPDGHIASLFPGDPLLLEEEQWVAYVETAPKPPPRRLTLTLPTLASAELVVLAAFGSAKARVVREALQESERSSLPVSMLLRRTRRALVLLDRAAASLVEHVAK